MMCSLLLLLQVLFSAYAPLVVCAGAVFPLSIWAYLRAQEAEARAAAAEKGSTVRGDSKQEFLV